MKWLLVAIAATVAVTTFLVLGGHELRAGHRPDAPYRDLGANYFDAHDREHFQRTLVRRLERLGYSVSLTPAA